MTTTAPTSRRGKLRAILAGGLVLGVGAAITLAAWNDSEFATATFSAGTFNLEGSSTNGVAFTEHPDAATAAPLAFVVNPNNLAPNDVVAAPFAVRLAAGTTSPAVVTLSTANSTGVENLTYEVLTTAAFGCTAATTGTVLVPSTAVGITPADITFPVATGTPTADPGAPVFLCFKVTAGVGLDQGQTGNVTWQFSATSQP